MRLESSAFDSQFYARKIGRLIAEPDDDAAALRAAIATARAEGYELLLLRVASDDPLRAVIPGAPIETLVTSVLDRSRPVPRARDVAVAHVVRVSDPDDLVAIETITDALRVSHLHLDPRLPHEQTRALYAAWARNDVTGRAQRTVIARDAGQIAGYITLLDSGDKIVLDLVAVSPGCQGKGIGTAMIASVIDWVGERDATVLVGTQHDNRALALYERCGFVPRERHSTYHLWLDETP